MNEMIKNLIRQYEYCLGSYSSSNDSFEYMLAGAPYMDDEYVIRLLKPIPDLINVPRIFTKFEMDYRGNMYCKYDGKLYSVAELCHRGWIRAIMEDILLQLKMQSGVV